MTTVHRTWPMLVRGQRLRFVDGSTYFWTVRAVADDGRYAVCTTTGWKLYTIIDWKRGHRGTENLIFGRGCGDDQQAADMLGRLVTGESELTRRRWVWLRFHDVQPEADTLPGLVLGAFDAWRHEPQPYNNSYKDKPWSGLGPVVGALWTQFEHEYGRTVAAGVSSSG